jgi:diaminopimelate epimerase
MSQIHPDRSLRFVKGHCCGNDAIVIVHDGVDHLDTASIVELSQRRTGVGAEIVVELSRIEHHPAAPQLREEDPDVRWAATVHNARGELSKQTATALRVGALALIELGYESPARRETLGFLTADGIRDVLLGVANVTVDLRRWRLGDQRLVTVANDPVQRPGLDINLGIPTTVVAVATELDDLDLSQPVSTDPPLAQTSDHEVIFITPADPVMRNGIGQIRVRASDSRGVEIAPGGEAIATAALAFRHWGEDRMPNQWHVESPFGASAVRMFPTEEGEHVSVASTTQLICVGTANTFVNGSPAS